MNVYLLQQYLSNSAQKYPGRIAVEDSEKKISYAELEMKSNQLANFLEDLGFLPRETAGVFLPKSAEAITAFFGILKSGGCYVPLDAGSLPLNRISKIIELGEIQYLITSQDLWQKTVVALSPEQANIFKGRTIIFIDCLLAAEKPVALSVELQNIGNYVVFDPTISAVRGDRDADIIDLDLAYILYTSGSTGVPKGVMISHQNALCFINWANEYFEPSPGLRFACHASLNFDLSVFDIYAALASGGTLVLVPYVLNGNPRALLDWIGENKISYWYSVPSVWIAILNHARIDKDKLHNLKWILFAGEVFPPTYLKRLMVAIEHVSYINLYGPTETNVCTYHRVNSAVEVGDRPVPIGRACENTEIVVLNAEMEPIGVGEEGELMAFGSGVTKGYFKNEVATSKAFIKSPLPHHFGRTLYKTGDIVRKNADGLYEYIGRNDFMAKISGFRVELQEVESIFYKHPHVEQAIAISYYCEERGSNRLGALIQSRASIATNSGSPQSQKNNVSVIELKNFASKSIPNYMVPEIIFSVEVIPQNANGKLDRLKSTEIFKELLAQ